MQNNRYGLDEQVPYRKHSDAIACHAIKLPHRVTFTPQPTGLQRIRIKHRTPLTSTQCLVRAIMPFASFIAVLVIAISIFKSFAGV